MQFLPTCIIGTSMEYKIFDNYMEIKKEYQFIPENWSLIFKTPLIGLLLGTVYFSGQALIPVSYMQT